jgi:hypothetical protein
VLQDRWLTTAERSLAIAIGLADLGGIIWVIKQPWKPLLLAELSFASVIWIALVFALANVPRWMTSWVNRRNKGDPKFWLWDWQGRVPPRGHYLRMDADLSKPVPSQTILSAIRRICASRAVCAVTFTAIFAIASLALRQFWMLATTCALAAVTAWEIYPRSGGIRYRWSLLAPDESIRAICLDTFSRALQEEMPIWDWHPQYFDLIRTPADGSRAEFSAATWIHAYALLHGDLETATRSVERVLGLLPDDAPVTQYIQLGHALYFYAILAPDEIRSELLVQRIQEIQWGLAARQGYIEAAIALAKGQRGEALSIVQTELDRIGAEGGTAMVQFRRALLTRCRDRASPNAILE